MVEPYRCPFSNDTLGHLLWCKLVSIYTGLWHYKVYLVDKYLFYDVVKLKHAHWMESWVNFQTLCSSSVDKVHTWSKYYILYSLHTLQFSCIVTDHIVSLLARSLHFRQHWAAAHIEATSKYNRTFSASSIGNPAKQSSDNNCLIFSYSTFSSWAYGKKVHCEDLH